VSSYDIVLKNPDETETKLFKVTITQGLFSHGVDVAIRKYHDDNRGEFAAKAAAEAAEVLQAKLDPHCESSLQVQKRVVPECSAEPNRKPSNSGYQEQNEDSPRAALKLVTDAEKKRLNAAIKLGLPADATCRHIEYYQELGKRVTERVDDLIGSINGGRHFEVTPREDGRVQLDRTRYELPLPRYVLGALDAQFFSAQEAMIVVPVFFFTFIGTIVSMIYAGLGGEAFPLLVASPIISLVACHRMWMSRQEQKLRKFCEAILKNSGLNSLGGAQKRLRDEGLDLEVAVEPWIEPWKISGQWFVLGRLSEEEQGMIRVDILMPKKGLPSR
jgi:hypothetical protein